MSVRPRVLVIDDIVGNDRPDQYDLQSRRLYCRSLGLNDEAQLVESPTQVVAGALFSSGQDRTPAGRENSLRLVEEVFHGGWPSAAGRYWSAVLVDMKFGEDERFGLKIIERIHRLAPQVPIIVVSGLNQLEVRAGESLRDAAQRLGAQEFLAAPGSDHDVDPGFRSTPENFTERLEGIGLLPDPEQQVVGVSLSICLALRDVRNLIPTHLVGQLLLLGEAGSGKSHLLGYVHRHVARLRGKPLHSVVCNTPALSGTSEDMQKKALFGTTDATGVKAHAGAFEEARDGGVVFLDEIGELTPGSQSDLLGPLQPLRSPDGRAYRSVKRMGSTDEIQSRCFVLAATNRELDEMVRERGFSGALLQRFDNKRIVVPPLKERKSDLPLLVQHFLRTACSNNGVKDAPRLDVAKSSWEQYADNHTVRQLANAINSVIAKNKFRSLLTENDFSQAFRDPDQLDSTPQSPAPVSPSSVHRTVSDLVKTIEHWHPDPRMDHSEFAAAFERLDVAFAQAKLRLWRDLLARQQALTGSVKLLPTVKQLLGKSDIPNSKSGDLALQIFQQAGIYQQPDDPTLAEIWDRRRGSRKQKPDPSEEG